MRFMVGQEIANGNLPIRCMNRTCSVYFVPRNERNMYCSEQCKNQVQQRRLQSFRREQRVMEALKACQSGTSVKEAAVQYKLTLPYLQKRLLFAAEKHSRP